MADLIPAKEEMRKALAERHGGKLQEKFSSATVAVCGLGGLGSNIAAALVRAGIGKLILIDFDRVDVANLNRQQYKASQVGMPKSEALAENLREADPYADIEVFDERITPENIEKLLGGADIICEAFDDPEEKAMLVSEATERMPEKYIIAASGMAGLGSSNDIKTRKVGDRLYICGDGRSDVSDGCGILSSRVMLCAAHQAHMVLRIIAGDEDA